MVDFGRNNELFGRENYIQLKFVKNCHYSLKMAPFRRNRISLLYAHAAGIIDDDEFVLLYDLNTSKNPDLPYWNYEPFELDSMEDEGCKTEFRFHKNDVYNLVETLDLPDQITCYNGLVFDPTEALCIFLKRFSYPCRYSDLIPRFGRPAPSLSIISNHILNFIYRRWNNLLTNFNQPWLNPASLQSFADAVHNRGAALNNCFGFVDGTVRRVCKPGQNQRVLYNGHKRVHAIKFQAVGAPNGLCISLFGPVEGRRHDSDMLVDSGLLPLLQIHAVSPNGGLLCIYGDPAYPHWPQLQALFKSARLTPMEEEWNKSMSKVRIQVEWMFGDIINYFKYLDFKKNMKLQLSAVGKMYIVCTLLQNARSCMYGSLTADYFGCSPPAIDDYFQ